MSTTAGPFDTVVSAVSNGRAVAESDEARSLVASLTAIAVVS
jgi:hypothetical protein